MEHRGYTGHEHLYEFGLINMNGRMYDPLLSSFLSPDNYMQDPTSQQGFNRYAYCMYNPLKYVDPSGNRYFGYDEAAIYKMIEAMQQQVFHEWYSVYAAAAESVQLTVKMACGLFSQGLDTHTNGSGNHGGPGGGKTFLEAFKELCKTHGIEYEPGKPIPEKLRTDAFLKEFQETFFPNMPMEYILNLTTKDYPFDGVHGVTQAEGIFDDNHVAIISGYSCVYLNPDYVFESPENMFYTMGHEFVHVSQYYELRGEEYSIFQSQDFRNIIEEHAGAWNKDMGRPLLSISSDVDYTKNPYYNRLAYQNFYWLNNLIHP